VIDRFTSPAPRVPGDPPTTAEQERAAVRRAVVRYAVGGISNAGATLSTCGRYRYHLWRSVSSSRTRPALFVMLNPSRADASIDDPTIRKCIGFASRLGCGRVEVVNLYAFRATDPRDLVRHVEYGGDAIGPENDATIAVTARDIMKDDGIVIAAWGAHPIAARDGRDWRVAELVRRAAGAEVMCLGTSKSSAPRHPLMLAYDTPLTRWS
jgi:hypothetical protein